MQGSDAVLEGHMAGWIRRVRSFQAAERFVSSPSHVRAARRRQSELGDANSCVVSRVSFPFGISVG